VTGIRFRCTLASLLLVLSAAAVAAPEYIQSEQTAPGSVGESLESVENAFVFSGRPRTFNRLGDVFRKGALNLNLRNYYFHRERQGRDNLETWAQGGELAYATASWKNRLRLGSTLYTSQKLHGPKDEDGTLLLRPGQKSFTVLGEAYLDARLYGNLTLKAYRQKFNLPYLNASDSRMVPNTFEAVTLMDASGDALVYGVSHTWRMKKRDATSFVSMTEAAGIKGRDRGVSSAALRYTFPNGANLGLVNHYGKDFVNIFYSDFNSRARFRRGLGVQFSAQYTRQNSVGDELGGDFDTYAWGAKVAASYGGGVLTLAHTSTASDAAIRSSWGGKPSYLSIMVKSFDRRAEDAWLLGMSTDFRFLGNNPFSGFMSYAWGETPDHGSNASPDQSEFDITLDYKPESGVQKGLWFRLRGALVDQRGDGSSDSTDVRLIVNYDFPIH